MEITINYILTLFEQSNLSPTCFDSTFKAPHKLQNKIKANTNMCTPILEEEHMVILE